MSFCLTVKIISKYIYVRHKYIYLVRQTSPCKVVSMSLKAEISEGSTKQDKIVSQQDLIKVLEGLEERITTLENTLADLRAATSSLSSPAEEPKPDSAGLLLLPDHLRKTMIALIEMGQATASQLAEKTGRVRNLESSYLNQLERMGLVERFREGRQLCFGARQIDISSSKGVLEQLRKKEKIDDKVSGEIARIYNLPKDAVPKWLARK